MAECTLKYFAHAYYWDEPPGSVYSPGSPSSFLLCLLPLPTHPWVTKRLHSTVLPVPVSLWLLPSHSSCKPTLPTQHASQRRELIGHAVESHSSVVRVVTDKCKSSFAAQMNLTKQGQGERVEVKGTLLLFRLSKSWLAVS